MPRSFDKDVIPKVGAERRKIQAIQEETEQEKAKMKAQIDELLKQLEAQQEAAKKSEDALLAFKQDQSTAKKKLQHQKAQRTPKVSSAFTESETRTHLIDLALREAGWSDLHEGRELEYPVQGMPVTDDNPRGNGYADYVLWNDNGLPLAIIEAKRTSVNASNGKHQASLYADCLETMHGQRPVIFYTNGYETYIWDDTFYSLPRRIYGFYTKEELVWTIQKRKTRKDIRIADINASITGRPYQLEGIKRTAESFVKADKTTEVLRGAKRHALLVMATGSGKTRTSASIVDILSKSNWVKRVLFLADRNALVRQAKNAFGEHLPELSSINHTKEKENNTTRLVFSTYQSIINKIDREKTDDERFYGVGHFDLIIVDEAHRSVYNKFGIIFEYFDALLLGLTATPKKDIDFNTYDLFECTDGNPTFAYELEDAVNSGYLNPYKNHSVTTSFLREGLKYKELSDDEREEYEEAFRDDATGLFPEQIRNSAFNKWLFNGDTVDIILDELMQKGLKIEGGDKLGRTIVFAANQDHAEFIQERFIKRYPYLPAGFIEVVHNKISHNQSIIDQFCDHRHENLPQIAVSVDMMDTGIDAPRVLNLVFFKVVRSYAKFWQMIGRGTRLCPDVYGAGKEKTDFLIFDVCQNFEFFDEKENGITSTFQRPITQQIFITRLSVSQLLLETGEEDDRVLAGAYLDTLQASIKSLDTSRFDVQMRREYVDRFADRSAWNGLVEDDRRIIEKYLSPLPVPESINEKARRFDLMMLKFEQARLLMTSGERGYRENVINIADHLSTKYSIPQVLKSKPLIERLKDPDFYKDLSNRKIEEIRIEIRELVQYIEEKEKEIVNIDIPDILEESDADHSFVPRVSGELYKRQVEKFIRENRNHITINKLNTNQAITEPELEELQRILFDGEDRGTLAQYKSSYGDQPLGRFIRSIVGLDISSANELFSEFIQSGQLSADQTKFIDNIIQHLTRNGTIDKSLLFEPPFNDLHNDGLFGLFDDHEATKIIHILDGVNGNADVG